MEEAIQTLQKLAKALRETYETTNTAIPWKEALNIVQSIEKLEEHVKEREKRENDALNIIKTRLEKIEKILDQLALKKGESEKSKGESYVEAAIRGSKAAPA
jgi:methylthioribose-1-phosphate isomerase